MKKLFFAGLLSACTVLLVSCLESGSNVQSRTGVPGIVTVKADRTMIMVPDFYHSEFYDPSIGSLGLEDGDCILFGYTVDLSESANTYWQTSGVVQGSVSSTPYVVTQYPCLASMEIDTSVLREKEQPVAYAISGSGGTYYFLDKLFLSSDLTMNTEQKTFWDLYYDPDLPTTEINGETVYTLFLRAEITDPGKKPVVNGYTTSVFDIKQFIDTISKKNKGNDKVFFKFDYINEIKEDGTFTWAQSEVLPFAISE